ncbi:hypothetical protein JL721_12556 [Aureococcus anophagefferens]|nr:hypothetical protein JL721_12556 [Aureococcus anophagefferens]
MTWATDTGTTVVTRAVAAAAAAVFAITFPEGAARTSPYGHNGESHDHVSRERGRHGSITAAVAAWGALIRRKQGATPYDDVTLQKVGYQTDNGAFYCFCGGGDCSQTLIDKGAELRDHGAPMGYLSFQGAGASSGRGQAAPWCVSTWGVDGGLGSQYPLSVGELSRAFDAPVQLYAPYFCPGSDYFNETSPWTALVSNTSREGCRDYAFEDSWDVGVSSLLVWALGKAPSKDTLWTSDNNRTATPGCPWTPDHETAAAPLHVAVALMSGGPVGISDGLGHTDYDLLKSAISADGTLLNAAKSLTSVDSILAGNGPAGARARRARPFGSAAAAHGLVSFKLKDPLP